MGSLSGIKRAPSPRPLPKPRHPRPGDGKSQARQNYYRVNIPGKGAVDRDGRITDRPERTHHPLTGLSFSDVSDILDIIEKIRERGQ